MASAPQADLVPCPACGAPAGVLADAVRVSPFGPRAAGLVRPADPRQLPSAADLDWRDANQGRSR